jgi:nicotinate-nucleotide adenylyltransferase
LKSKIGIIGGAFDPIHIGHLIIGEILGDELGLDLIQFIPSYNPPHKTTQTPFDHRYQMTLLATKRNHRFKVSDIETRIGEVTYTKDVIEQMRKELTGDFYLIIGSDQYREIDTWYQPEAIFKMAKVVVVPRPGYEVGDDLPFRREIILTTGPRLDISSTMIRERIKVGKSVRYLIPAEVFDYINQNRIYQ